MPAVRVPFFAQRTVGRCALLGRWHLSLILRALVLIQAQMFTSHHAAV